MKKEYIYLIGTIIVLGIVFGIVKKFKSKSTAGTARTDARTTKIDNKAVIKDMTPYQYPTTNVLASKLLPPLQAITLAKELKKSMRGFTNESKLFDSLSYIKTKAQLSQVAKAYSLEYGKNLQTDIIKDLNGKEEQQFAEWLKTLKNE